MFFNCGILNDKNVFSVVNFIAKNLLTENHKNHKNLLISLPSLKSLTFDQINNLLTNLYQLCFVINQDVTVNFIIKEICDYSVEFDDIHTENNTLKEYTKITHFISEISEFVMALMLSLFYKL